jgi:hypothetical protein
VQHHDCLTLVRPAQPGMNRDAGREHHISALHGATMSQQPSQQKPARLVGLLCDDCHEWPWFSGTDRVRGFLDCLSAQPLNSGLNAWC